MRISVITVCRNAAATIEGTIESFLRQDHPDKEMVVVDGASSDETVAIVRRLGIAEVSVVSEPDAGLYDAMNKGLRRFSGEAVGFLNADDRFSCPDALSALAASLETADIAYGDLDIVDARAGERVVRRWRGKPWRSGAFRRGWMPPHPTFYCRRAVVERVGAFDLRYGLAADYDFMLRALELGGFAAAQVRRVLVDMNDGGLSAAGLRARIRHNLEALNSRQRWLGSGPIDYALFAKPLSKIGQFVNT